jgi:hypothetical protein
LTGYSTGCIAPERDLPNKCEKPLAIRDCLRGLHPCGVSSRLEGEKALVFENFLFFIVPAQSHLVEGQTAGNFVRDRF